MSIEILQPLEAEDIPKLLEVLSRDLPHSSWIYNWIKTQCSWAKKLSRVRVLVLCPYGDWTTGTVVALNIGLVNRCKVFGAIYSTETQGLLLKKCLIESNMIPWRGLSDYMRVSEMHAAVYLDALNAKDLQIKHQATCAVAYLPPEEAALVQTPELPKGVRIASLTEGNHLDTVCDNWPHLHRDFKPVVRMMLRYNPSFGIFVDQGDGEELASMIVQSDSVGLGILQTVNSHRRKGFAHVLLAHVTRLMGMNGIGPQGHIIANNYSALELFKKVGYSIIGQSRWVSIDN